MIVGIFSPVINWCGGAEWVAVNMINVLKENGHKVVVLTDKPLNQTKFQNVFNRKLPIDQQIIFPFRFFPSNDLANVYTDSIRLQVLKAKCDIVIDTFSNAILPATNVAYIHHPLLRRLEMAAPFWSTSRNKLYKTYFYPYRSYLKLSKGKYNKLVFANSNFTARAIKAETNIDSYVLYPSVSSEILNYAQTDFQKERGNSVTTVARISAVGKNLKIIPQIASLTSDKITFNIVGLLDSEATLISLLRQIKRLKLSDRVKIYTNYKREQLRHLLLNTRVYLHPTINEHFGISIVEAMSSGCIPVVHNSGGPIEFVPRSHRYDSVEEAAMKVEKAINEWSPENAINISKSAEKFSEKNFAHQFTKVLNSYYN